MLTRIPALAIVATLLALPAFANETDYLISLYKHLHANPELSLQEEATAERIADELEIVGFDVTRNVGGHGLIGLLKNGKGPTLLIRTDLDALPVREQTGLAYASGAKSSRADGKQSPVMHACGHDIHMSVFVGTARHMATHRENWRGTLVMIGQPAEELGLGAKAMIEDGLFSRIPRPSFNLALHVNADLPAGTVGHRSGYMMATADTVAIKVQGVGGHGAFPHKTKDPIVLAASIIMQLQTLVSRELDPVDPAVVSIGTIHGGTKSNIISDEVVLEGTVRYFSDATRDLLQNGIRRIAKAEAIAMGLPENKYPQVSFRETPTPSLWNDPALNKRLVKTFSKALGKDKVIEVPPVTIAEDFSRYGRDEPRIPSVMFQLGTVDQTDYEQAKLNNTQLPSLHSPFYAPAPVISIETGVTAMTGAAVELLSPE